MRRHSPAARALAAALLLPTACAAGWRSVPADAGAGRSQEAYPRARLSTRDGRTRELTDVRVRPDSVVGTAADATRARVAVALGDVTRLERPAADPAPAVANGVRFALDGLGVALRGLGTFVACLAGRAGC